MATQPEPNYALSPEEFLSTLDLSAVTAPVPQWSRGDLSRSSIDAFVRQRTTPLPRPGAGKLHLTGAAVINHAIPLEETSRLLAALQRAVTFLSASVRQDSPRPRISASVRQATALFLTPQLAPGSVVLTVVSRPAEDSSGELTPSMIPVASEADSGVQTFLDLCNIATSDSLQLDALNTRLRALGPRAARTVLQLTNAVIADSVEMDFSWTSTDSTVTSGVMARRQALAIRDTIRSGRIEVERVTLIGTLITISQVVPLDLVLESGHKVQLQASDEQRASSAEFYNTRVTVTAEETVTTSAGGTTRPHYLVVSIREYKPGDTATDLDDSTTVEPTQELLPPL